MTTLDALAFLQAHQPLPDDDGLGQRPDLMQTYHEVLQHLREYPDPQCIPLLLRSFGGWNGFGLYQTVEDVLYQFNEQLVVAALLQELEPPNWLNPGTLYWHVDLCTTFSNARLFDPLVVLLNHPLADIRHAVVYALGLQEAKRVAPVLQRQLAVEDDEEVIKALREVLEEL
ncbi:HEAT repeat domain-containing protein [Hymenobacter sp. DH14]|uniref:HEAT repeat domain-containing protein n=1 Tax=Hymenobacter cyanobacteriorum TaxID=2926463 RepID=A0A9X1VHA7_9BACT|nr:HEAT repeat domain-containing protein [Hymenobacter cyanobacteriorum]MCI1188851.1 HEAT repeat domain-containing protein [Hymenobacter cyanobacteriorum]